ncbi:DnaB-like helicase N-terminal domain-containing protein [uncultured Desulfovibrio sp.]|uniref:DnaB-like helicase N-terminal domain-containing protein n=1 Tax=uncultured Desulfovibrio sp. TaxID=167968 RepID=UPI0026320A8E|nr:DnaB-like helicase N-terminal domain-containing protein [uncultured Desulfovibrio sp.]
MGRKKNKTTNDAVQKIAAEKTSSQHEEDAARGKALENALFNWERRVLGLVLLHPSSLFYLLETISPDDFCFVRHKILYKTMQELYDAGESIDLVTLAERLRSDGNFEKAGGPIYLGELVPCLEDKSKKRKKS